MAPAKSGALHQVSRRWRIADQIVRFASLASHDAVPTRTSPSGFAPAIAPARLRAVPGRDTAIANRVALPWKATESARLDSTTPRTERQMAGIARMPVTRSKDAGMCPSRATAGCARGAFGKGSASGGYCWLQRNLAAHRAVLENSRSQYARASPSRV
ncbi:hypothetical protein [Burkholderia territorii]|uniref:hypothetical protein n=1 Tax=Burkholderia territorii TaxID=1503055 RepID=UPI000B136394|nr:hypothetical protein [Burkholderia territorii]